MGNVTEFPAIPANAGANSETAAQRSQWVVMRNSRFLVAFLYAGSIFSVFTALCSVLIAIDAFIPLKAISFTRLLNAASWGCAAACALAAVPWMWKMGRAMAHNEARLDHRGVEFHFGPARQEEQLFIPWDQVSAITSRRAGNNQVYTVAARDGSHATFSSYTFFRPGKLAKMIAARVGLTILKG